MKKKRVNRPEIETLVKEVNLRSHYYRFSFPRFQQRQVVFVEYYDNGIYKDTHIFQLPKEAKEFLVKILNDTKQRENK